MLDIAGALKANDATAPSGKNLEPKSVYDVEVGGRLKTVEDIRNIAVGLRGGRIVRIRDVAEIKEGPEERTRVSYLIDKGQDSKIRNAVSIVLEKKKGSNVVDLSKALIVRARVFSPGLPGDVTLDVMRDYGDSANEKSKELIEHLLIATFSVALLIAIFMGSGPPWWFPSPYPSRWP